jgi:hypothetical protein
MSREELGAPPRVETASQDSHHGPQAHYLHLPRVS